MSYQDRLRRIRYIAPLGGRFEPLYDSVARSGGKKASVIELPQQDLPDVQDLGDAAQKIPLTLYFTGEDYDLTADAFWNALAQKGVGTLTHPRWGTIRVLPISRSQTESFVSGMGRAVFEVEFLRVSDFPFLPNVFPFAVVNKATSILTTASAIVTAAVVSYELLGEIADAPSESIAQNAMAQNLSGTISLVNAELGSQGKKDLAKIPTSGDSKTLYQSALAALGILAKEPVPLARKLFALDAITTLADQSASGSVAASSEILTVLAVVTGGAECAARLDTATENRASLLSAAEKIKDLRNTLLERVNHYDATMDGFQFDHTILASTYKAGLDAAALAHEAGLQAALERSFILRRVATPLDLCYEIYKSLARLDEFFELNDFQGTELFLINPGRRIRYYEAI